MDTSGADPAEAAAPDIGAVAIEMPVAAEGATAASDKAAAASGCHKTCKRIRSKEGDEEELEFSGGVQDSSSSCGGENAPGFSTNKANMSMDGDGINSMAKKPREDRGATPPGDCKTVPLAPPPQQTPQQQLKVENKDMSSVSCCEARSDKSESQVETVIAGNAAATAAAADYSDDDDEDYDDLDDDDDDDGGGGDDDDFLDEADDDDVMMEDSKSDAADSTTSTTFSGCSFDGSVGSNTPSLIGENLESFCLESGLNGEDKKDGSGKKAAFRISGGPLVKSPLRPLRRSLFSHVPPTINFVHHNEVSETPLPAEVRKHLRWKLSNITPAVVKRIVTNSGFRLMRKTCSEWGGTWGKHMKSPMFKDLNESQKLNHLPGTFNIGRKDRLWKNYQRLRIKFGRNEFGFLPRTFLLPSETKLLRKVWERKGCKAKWIVKPPALARGNGIKVVNKWSQIPKQRPLIVQKYLARPHLINETKYDLRIYVLLTSLSPLRLFLYDEGLVRFASNPYSSDAKSLHDVYTHLTNYSINKNSSSYQANEDPECRQGHKWTLASLWTYFAEKGIDSKPVIESIKDLVIKTVISAEANMANVYRPNLQSHYCGYELFGFDVLLDHKLKPWLIEVNISPSLHSSSPLDLDVKSPLATEVFNLARYHIPPAKMSAKTQREILAQLNMTSDATATAATSGQQQQLCMDRRLYARELSKSERAKHDRVVKAAMAQAGEVEGGAGDADAMRATYLDSILETLTPDDVRILIRSEDELAQATHFSRIFPTQDTASKYFKYFETPRYYNLLLDAWEAKYGDDNLRAAAIDRLERLCVTKFHLKVPTISATNASANSAGNAGNKVAANGSSSGATTAAAVGNANGNGNGNDTAKSLNGTAAGASSANKKAVLKKARVPPDVSMLKAPTGASCAVFDESGDGGGGGDAPKACGVGGCNSDLQKPPPPTSAAAPAAAGAKVKSISVTAKHHSLQKSTISSGLSSIRSSSLAKKSSTSSSSLSSSSPESMSVSGDTPTPTPHPATSSSCCSDKSRSPSPIDGGTIPGGDGTNSINGVDNQAAINSQLMMSDKSRSPDVASAAGVTIPGGTNPGSGGDCIDNQESINSQLIVTNKTQTEDKTARLNQDTVRRWPAAATNTTTTSDDHESKTDNCNVTSSSASNAVNNLNFKKIQQQVSSSSVEMDHQPTNHR